VKPYKTTASRIVWSSPWYRIRQDELLLPDGSSGVYNVVEKPPAVWIVPLTLAGKVVLIRNYRYTVDDWCLEIPAGSQQPQQRLAETAAQELREEIGGVARNLAYVGQFYTANGICNEISHVFLATGVTLGPPSREPTEVMETRQVSVSEALHLAATNQISDGPSALALLLCAERLRALDG